MKAEKFLTLKPSEGHLLYNGNTVSDCVYLPLTADTSIWKEITEAEADEILAKDREAAEEERKKHENDKQH